MANNGNCLNYITDIESVALRIDNCENNEFNGLYQVYEDGRGFSSDVDRMWYKKMEDDLYRIFWDSGNWYFGCDVSDNYVAAYSDYEHPTSTGVQPPESGWVAFSDGEPSNTRITFLTAEEKALVIEEITAQ